MKKREAVKEITTIELVKDKSFYIPYVENELIELINFLEKGINYKVSVVEDFKELTTGISVEENNIISLNKKTKCLIITADKNTTVEISTVK